MNKTLIKVTYLYLLDIFYTYSYRVRGECENGAMRRIFGPKGVMVTGGRGVWRKLHNEELYDMYSSPNVIRIAQSV